MNPIPFILLASLFLGGSLFAQSDDDIFAEGAFDEAVAQGQAEGEANKLVWLGGVSLASTTNLILPTDGLYASQSLFTGKGFLKATNPAVGALFLSYTYNQALWSSTDDPSFVRALTRTGNPPTAPQYGLSEFHLSFDVDKKVFLRLGNQLIDWGASAVWSPSDFINRRVADPDAPVDTRAGKAGLRVHVPWSGGNVFLFADASRSIATDGRPRDLVETGAVGVKVDTTLAGWNLGVVGNFGKTSEPRSGLTVSGALLGIDVWGEAGAVLPVGGHTLTWAASLGGERSFGFDSEWTARMEGFWNPDGKGDVELTAPVLASYTPFYWGKAYLYAEVLKKKLLLPEVTGSLSGTTNLGDRSWTTTASLRTAFPGTVPFSLFVQHNGGALLREFTLATGGPAWTLGLRSLVEF